MEFLIKAFPILQMDNKQLQMIIHMEYYHKILYKYINI